mmetsp:Transcript_49414/g.112151  ORF Transcript_49414/g.112151 Transcript_49414/m.112151 type:complete len:205 (-) Transcript_49414:704-1318(-)
MSNWMKRFPFSNGLLRRGIPSPSTAFIMRPAAAVDASPSTHMVEPEIRTALLRASSREHCLKTARPPRSTKQPMPLSLSWPLVTISLHRSGSSVRPSADPSIPGQSLPSKHSHSAAGAPSSKGSYATGLITSPGLDLTMRTRPSRCFTSISKPHSASESEIFRDRYRSSPFRLKTSWGVSTTVMITSPASPSGISFAFSLYTNL